MAPLKANSDLYCIPKFFMKIGGFWPTERRTNVSVAIFCFNLAVLVTYFTILLVDCLRNHTKPSHRIFTELLATIMTHMIIRAYGGQMVPLIKATTDYWSSITDPEEQEIMRTHTAIGSYYFCFAFAWTSVYVYTTVKVFWWNLQVFDYFSIGILSPEERTALIDNFFRVVFIQLLKIVVIFCINVMVYGTDLLFWSLSMQLSAQFKIHVLRCQRFLRIKSKSKSRKLLRLLAERHNQILDLYRAFEDAFNVYVGFRVIWLQLQICIIAHDWDTYSSRFSYKLSRFQDLILFLSSLFVFHYAGDYLISCCEDIGEVFRQCEWYTLSKESRINFGIIARRSQTSRTLTLAKFYKLNLRNLLYVVLSVYTYNLLIIAIADRKRV